MPDLVINTWYGVLAPAGTPPAIIERLNREITKIVNAPGMSQRFAKAGVDPLVATPAEFAKFVQSDYQKWLNVANTANLTFE
jgi:tripartite-type tricarboxylate transporter receptor subunit TctC